MNLTVDASVFVAAAPSEEAHYSVSRQFLLRARSLGATVICPTLVLPECAAAIARSTGNAALAQDLVDLIEGFPGLQLVPLEEHLAREAVEVATTHRLRGADSVYIAVAATFQAELITWDSEMLVRGTQAASTCAPTEWIQRTQEPG